MRLTNEEILAIRDGYDKHDAPDSTIIEMLCNELLMWRVIENTSGELHKYNENIKNKLFDCKEN